MSVRRLSQSFLSTRGRGKGSTFVAGYGFGVDEMDLLQRTTVGAGGAAAITFSSIPQTYQHLQLRIMGKLSSNQQGVWVRFNDDAAANYSCHFLYGTGASAIAASRLSDGGIDSILPWNNTDWFSGIIDIVDYTNTSKHKVTRSLSGSDANGGGLVALTSGSWRNTSSVTKIHLSDQLTGGTFQQHSVASLYGVVG